MLGFIIIIFFDLWVTAISNKTISVPDFILWIVSNTYLYKWDMHLMNKFKTG